MKSVPALLLFLLLSCAMAPRAASQDDPALTITAAVKRAAQARAEGRTDEAKKALGIAAAVAADRVPLRRLMAAVLVDSGMPEFAVQVCAATIAMAPDDAKLRGVYGTALVKTRKFVQAIPELERATQLEPLEKEWWISLCRAQLYANHDASAFVAIDRAKKLAPDDPGVLEVQAECEYRNMSLAQCEATSRALLQKDPTNAMGWQLLIRVRRNQGRLDDALGSADQAIKAIGRHPEIVLERGLVLLAANRNEEAVKDLREVSDRLPNDARPHLHLCKAYTRLGLAKEASTAKARFGELSPDIGKAATRKSDQ